MIDVERILSDFRDWLSQQPPPPPPPTSPPTSPPAETVDLAALVRQFTALRQEVNLQTRASRSQLEQNAQTLERLGQAVEEFQSIDDEPLKPLLKALVETRDALALAHKHVVKTKESLAATKTPPRFHVELPAFARWFGVQRQLDEASRQMDEWVRANEPDRTLLDSLIVGYSMSLQRIDRTLEQNGLERIECVGRPFDPETMEVVEVVKDAGRAASEVIEDVRPGYRHRGKLFRCAQVRVARA